MSQTASVTTAVTVTPIEAIKQSINISDALERYAGAKVGGGSYRDRMQICCPFHSDHSPSMTVYLDSNKCRCWTGSCPAHGHPNDQIDVVQMAEGISRTEAIHRLMKDLGLSTGDNTKKAVEKAQLAAAFEKECKKMIKYIEAFTNGIYIARNKAFDNVHSVDEMNAAWESEGDMISEMYRNNDRLMLYGWMLTEGNRKQKKDALSAMKAFQKEMIQIDRYEKESDAGNA